MKILTKLTLSLIALMGITFSMNADVNTPYSMYGYGILGERATSMQRQMGGVGYAMRSGRQINAMNPASYAAIDSLTFLWDMGANLSMVWNKEGSDRNHTTGGGLDYVTMEFPLSKYMGMSIGMIPLSQVGYSFGSDIKFGTRSNQGSGGINEAYAGISGKVGGFSAGVNISYDFGTIQNDVYAQPQTPNASQSLFEHIMEIRDWNILAGIQYNQKLDRFSDLTFGATYSPKKSFHGNTWLTQQDLGSQSLPDTISYSSMKGKYYSPQSVGVGIAYKYEKSKRIVVEVDYTWQQWSKATYSSLYNSVGTEVFEGMKFSNRSKIAVGGEYTHNIRGSYLERIPVRIGGFYTKDYLRIGDSDVKEYGLSIGAGLNAPQGKTMINVGVEWMHRQASAKNLLQENYLNVTLGINFNEVWFWKRRIK